LKTPDTAAELTLEWLDEIAPHENQKCHLESFEADEDFGAVSVIGTVVRVSIAHSSMDCGPATLIIKFPNLDGDWGTRNREIPVFAKEAKIYGLLSESPKFAIPKLFGSYEGHSPSHVVLVIEDLSPATTGSQLAGCSVKDATTILGQLAGIHEHFWGAQNLPENPPGEQIAKVASGGFNTGMEILTSRKQDQISKTIDSYQWLGSNLASMFEHRRGKPSTLIHGDFHAENILFTSDPLRPTVLIDWQLSSRGPAAHDVSHFLVGNLSVSDRQSSEGDLLQGYYEQLTRAGTVRYSYDEFYLDYRASVCRSMIRPANGYARAPQAVNPEDIYRLTDAIFERVNAAIIDLDPVDAMKELGY
jgi:hypothetical protein